jgi:hypothetical protein
MQSYFHNFDSDFDPADPADLPHLDWICEWCEKPNSCLDACCQYCDGPPSQADYDADHRIDERKHSRD